MALENCPSCGKAYNKTTRNLCPPCWDREQGLYDLVSEYMHVHPDAEAPEVLEQIQVRHEDLEYLIKRGRLLGFERLVASVLRCYRCNEATARGPYCNKCVMLIKTETQAGPVETPLEQAKPKPETRAHSRSKDEAHRGHDADYWRSRARR